MTTIIAKPLPFNEQIDYFRRKINMPTATYLDIYGEAHDYAFAVAGSHTQEIVGDFRKAVDEVIEQGGTLELFRKRFDEIVEKHSWEYNGGRNWRSRIIYDTNLYASYNHGRYTQQKALADVLPYWEYEHNDSAHPRPEHQAWDGKVLRADDPWWDYHYPVRAYGCHCTVRALDDFDLQAEGKTVAESPSIEWEEKLIGQRSGSPRIVRVPKGVDPSFEHPKRFVPVHNADQILLHKIAQSKADNTFIAKQARTLVSHPPIMQLMNKSMKEWVGQVAEAVEKDNGKLLQNVANFKYLGALPPEILDKLPVKPVSAVVAMDKGQMKHALREAKQNAGVALPKEFWENLPEKIQNPDAILLETGQKTPTLLYVFKEGEGKVAVKVDYDAYPTDGIEKKPKTKMNMVTTGSVVSSTSNEWRNFEKSYKLLWGAL